MKPNRNAIRINITSWIKNKKAAGVDLPLFCIKPALIVTEPSLH